MVNLAMIDFAIERVKFKETVMLHIDGEVKHAKLASNIS